MMIIQDFCNFCSLDILHLNLNALKIYVMLSLTIKNALIALPHHNTLDFLIVIHYPFSH